MEVDILIKKRGYMQPSNPFIVDNSESGWTGLRYLKDWCDLSSRLDIATGFFEIGAFLALDQEWQKLEKIRLLMGGEMTYRTRGVFTTRSKSEQLSAILEQAKSELDRSLEAWKAAGKDGDPFLRGVPAILEALQSGKIECRIHNKRKFHAKAYITHAHHEVIGAKALVGSSNFTHPGLTRNVELNVQIQSGKEVDLLQEWFENYWEESEEVTPELAEVVDRHVKIHSPFTVYARSLQLLMDGREQTASEWDKEESVVWPKLSKYQQEGYLSLMQIAEKHGGAFLCDGVGLGKTFVGLMVLERLCRKENKRVALFAPKAAVDGVWKDAIQNHLKEVGLGPFSNLSIFSHTDLSSEKQVQDFQQVAKVVDAIVIDEAHHFRNRGSKPKEGVWEDGSRYWRMRDLLDATHGGQQNRQVFLLTATPINNSLMDFRNMIELFSQGDREYFAIEGVHNLPSHFRQLESEVRRQCQLKETTPLADDLDEVSEALSSQTPLFRELVVQRSRAYVKRSQKIETEDAAVFPQRERPQVAHYNIRESYGSLLDLMTDAFSKEDPLFSLPMYNRYKFALDPEKWDVLEIGRSVGPVTLIRTQFLKRFESSIASFQSSCFAMFRTILAFLEVHVESDEEVARLDNWRNDNQERITNVARQEKDLFSFMEDGDDFLDEKDFKRWQDDRLSREDFKVDEMIEECYSDLEQLKRFLLETESFTPGSDDKLRKLIRLLKSNDLKGQKVIIFTEFSDTAKYLQAQLREKGFERLAMVSGGTGDKVSALRRFAPYYNASSSSEAEASGGEIQILIATDVLSEGLNLQDATKLINYDIHWNPVRLMQRIGRVDRRMNEDVEAKLLGDHPDLEEFRGKVTFWNFLPPDDLNAILSLYHKVTGKVLTISQTLGIEYGKLLKPDDDFRQLEEFNASYEGKESVTEQLRNELRKLEKDDPALEVSLRELPDGVFSGKEPSTDATGVFLCVQLPRFDRDGNFSLEAGRSEWYFVDLDAMDGPLLLGDSHAKEIAERIRCPRSEPRKCVLDDDLLFDIRKKVLRHVKDTWLKQINAPTQPAPVVKAWMEVKGG